jgi:hypothetical protein
MPKSRPFENIGQPLSLNQPTTETRTQVVAELLPQIQERGSISRIHSALNFHRGISRIPNIERDPVNSPPPPLPNLCGPVEEFKNVMPSANSSIDALGLSFEIPPSRITNVESLSTTVSPLEFPTANSSIEPNNALGLLFDTPPSRIPNVESLSTTVSPLVFETSQNEAYAAGTPFEPLGFDLSLNLQTTEPSANLSRPFIEPDNALGSWLDGPQNHMLDVQSSIANSSLPVIEPNNALGLTLGHPQSSVHIESLNTSASVPLIFYDDGYPELPSSGELNANFDFYGEDFQITEPSANFRQPTIEPNNFHQTQPPKSQELSITFGGKIGRQVRWQDIMPSVDQFIECCTRDTTHSLTVVLEPSGSTYDQWERRQTLKRLFDRLELTGSHGRNVVFNRISITVPDKAEDVDIMLVALPWNNSSGRRIPDANWEKIDITSASNLREFLWKGPFQQLSENFLYPADGLTLLSITSCRISINDAVELLRPCSSLEEVQLETLHDTKAVEQLTPKSGSKFKFTLKKLSVTSSVDLTSVLKPIEWAPESDLIVTFLDNGSQDANALSCAGNIPKEIGLRLEGNFSKQTIDRIQARR